MSEIVTVYQPANTVNITDVQNIVTIANATGPQGSQGPTGPTGSDGIVISATAPTNQSILWADTTATTSPSGAYTLIASTTLNGVVGPDRIYINDIAQDYKSLQLVIENYASDDPNGTPLFLRFNDDADAVYSVYDPTLATEAFLQFGQNETGLNSLVLTMPNYNSATGWKICSLFASATDYAGGINTMVAPFTYAKNTPITAIKLFVLSPSNALQGGTVKLYGLR